MQKKNILMSAGKLYLTQELLVYALLPPSSLNQSKPDTVNELKVT